MVERSVGLLVLTNIPKMGGVGAILQGRGEFSHERMAPCLWPGGYQVTCHGKIELSDIDEHGALIRETAEEIGCQACLMFCSIFLSKNKFNLTELSRTDTAVTFGIFFEEDPSFFEKVELTASTGGFRFLTKDKLSTLVDLKSFGKQEGVNDRRVTAMFLDEIEAVKKAFEILVPK